MTLTYSVVTLWQKSLNELVKMPKWHFWKKNDQMAKLSAFKVKIFYCCILLLVKCGTVLFLSDEPGDRRKEDVSSFWPVTSNGVQQKVAKNRRHWWWPCFRSSDHYSLAPPVTVPKQLECKGPLDVFLLLYKSRRKSFSLLWFWDEE